MNEPAGTPEAEAQDGPSPGMRTLGILMMAVALLGLVAHVTMYLMALGAPVRPDWLTDYLHGPGIKVDLVVAFITLVGNWFHYRRTAMNLDILSRIAIYLWILSSLLLWVRTPGA
jgi:hypothetical protein